RADRQRPVLARRPRPVRATARLATRPRSVPRACRLPRLLRCAAGGRDAVAAAGEVDAVLGPQCRACGTVLVGPFDPRVRGTDLAHPIEPYRGAALRNLVGTDVAAGSKPAQLTRAIP